VSRLVLRRRDRILNAQGNQNGFDPTY
jgi:hypothetical protein